MTIIYSMLGAVCIVVAVTALLPERLKVREYLILIAYVECMAVWGLKAGEKVSLIMLPMLLVLLAVIVKKRKIENICLSCMGYLINLLCNNIIECLLGAFFHVPVEVIQSKYYISFSSVYIIFLWGALRGIRCLLYSKNKTLRYTEAPKAVRYGLAVNLVLFALIFAVNISFGQSAGYSAKSVFFNCVLFFVSLLVSSLLIIVCANSMRQEEARKAEKHQQEVLGNYIMNLERVVGEMQMFRHDYKNILSTMAGYIRENQIEDLKVYFDREIGVSAESLDQNGAWSQLRDIRPMELKGFLYEKVLSALTKRIQIHTEVREEVCVNYKDMDDLVRILGIFIDNAVEAAEEAEKGEVWIGIARTEIGVIFEVENNFKQKPEFAKMAEKGYSTKGKNRGMGLCSAEGVLRRHSDMFHELRVMDEKVVQILEVEMC